MLSEFDFCSEKVEFNIEGNPYAESNKYYPGFQEIIQIAKPDQCTLVPDSLEQITSDHGWDFINRETSEDIDLVNSLKENSHRVSFFVDPIPEQLEKAKDTGTDRIEFYTCLLYTSPSPRDLSTSRMPSSA